MRSDLATCLYLICWRQTIECTHGQINCSYPFLTRTTKTMNTSSARTATIPIDNEKKVATCFAPGRAVATARLAWFHLALGAAHILSSDKHPAFAINSAGYHLSCGRVLAALAKLQLQTRQASSAACANRTQQQTVLINPAADRLTRPTLAVPRTRASQGPCGPTITNVVANECLFV